MGAPPSPPFHSVLFYVIIELDLRQNITSLKGTASRDFSDFFINHLPPKPLKLTLESFRIFPKFAEIFTSQGAPPVPPSLITVANLPRCQRHRWCSLGEISKKFETALIGYSGAWGKLIHEKNLKSKISVHCPFKPTAASASFTWYQTSYLKPPMYFPSTEWSYWNSVEG